MSPPSFTLYGMTHVSKKLTSNFFSLSNKDKIINEKEKTIADLNTELAKLNAEIASLKSQLAAANTGFENAKKDEYWIENRHLKNVVQKFC